MRLSVDQQAKIREYAVSLMGKNCKLKVFGSRAHDNFKGGDVDLLVELDAPVDNPAELAARLAAMVSRYMHGRKVDVLLAAPNLKELPIHAIARETGVPL